MTRGLLAKELRQHGFTLAFLLLLVVGGLVFIGANGALRRASGGGLAAVQFLHFSFVPLAGLVLGQILIATEFRQKTQLFLEGLPLPRWRMLAVKFALGFGVLLAAIALALFVAWWTQRGTAGMTPRFATLLALKSAGWVWFIFTLCFAHGFLGRYRLFFGVAIFFGLVALNGAGVRIVEFGPFALIDDRFAYERTVMPAAALGITAALGLTLAGLGFALGLVRDATVASLLAEKMSSREKVFLTFLSIAVMVVGTFLHEHYKNSTPVQMPGAVEVQRGVVRVVASAAVDVPTREEIAALERISARAAEELAALANYLGCKSFPPVFLVHRRDLAGGELHNGDLKYKQGVLVRANYLDAKFREDALHTWLVREALVAHTSGLAYRERNAWALDGLAEWWPRRERGLDPAWIAPARAAMPAGFSARHLAAWMSLRKAAGAEPARLLAATGIFVLGQRHGADARLHFLAAMFGPARPEDARGWIADVLHPARLRAAAGIDEETLVAEWRVDLAAARGNLPP